MRDVIGRIRDELRATIFDALLVFGSDNVQYLSRLKMPYLQSYSDKITALIWPRIGEPVMVCPARCKDTFRRLSMVKRIIGYVEGAESPIDTVVKEVKAMVRSNRRIGIDILRTPSVLFENLDQMLTGYELSPCDELLKKLRSLKTHDEMELLQDVAYRADHGIFGAVHHVLVTSHRSEMSLSEEIRVHCMERGLDVVGFNSVSQVASGEHARKFWPLAPNYGIGYDKPLKPGEYVRMEVKASMDGYWSDAARLMTQGETTPQQKDAYNGLVFLRKKAMEYLRPGSRCSDVYRAVKAEAMKRSIKLLDGLVVGHGIGVIDYEPPYLSASDDTELKPGMVLVVDPVIRGPDGEILRSKDTVVVTGDGCRLVGWYKDWREPYIANYTL